jgi:hypothetical protein
VGEMILQIIIYLMEMIVALIPETLYWCHTESTITAAAVYVISLYLIVKFTIWFTTNNTEKKIPRTIVVPNGLLQKVIESNGAVTIYAHPRWSGDLKEVEDFLKKDLNNCNYIVSEPRYLRKTFKDYVVVFSNRN